MDSRSINLRGIAGSAGNIMQVNNFTKEGFFFLPSSGNYENLIWDFLSSMQGIGGFVFGNENATSNEDRYVFPPFSE